jgi:CHAT domain-containing protein
MKVVGLFFLILYSHLVTGQDKDGLRLFEEGKYNEAMIIFRKNQSDEKFSLGNKLYEATCLIRLELNQEALDQLDSLYACCLKRVGNQVSFSSDSIRFQLLRGESLMHLGQNKTALEIFKACEKWVNNMRWQDSLIAAEVYNQIGVVYWSTDNLDEAANYLKLALSLKLKLKGELSLTVAGAHNNLGLIYAEEQPLSALENYRKALGIYSDIYGKNHPSVASTLNNIALVNNRLQKYHIALGELDDVQAIRQNVFGTKHPLVAFTRVSKSNVYAELGQYPQAESELKNALEIYQNTYGNSHPEIASTYNQMGLLMLKQRKFKEAISCYDLAIKANTSSDAMTLVSYNNPLVLLNSLMFKAQALEQKYLYKSLALKDLKASFISLQKCDTLLGQIRSSRVNQKDKLALGKIASELYPDAVRVAYMLYQLSYSQTYKLLTFDYAEKNKASVLQQAIAESNALQFAHLPDKVLDEEKQLREQISSLEHTLSSATEAQSHAEARQKLLQTNAQMVQFIQSLEKSYPEYYQLKYNAKTISVADIQKNLPNNTAVLSYLMDEKSGRLYLFLVSSTSFKIKSQPITTDFQRDIVAIRNVSRLLDREFFVEKAHELYRELFPFPSSVLKQKLVLIPEGKLGSIPFELLLTSKTQSAIPEKEWPFLLKQHAVSYAYSFNLLNERLSKDKPSNNTILLAAPVHFVEEQKLASLPGSESEIVNLQQLFSKNGHKTELLLKTKANELVFKENTMQSYGIIHLATHGMVNQSEPEFSQIYLQPSGKEDGHLYCNELYNLRLDARLITLSACETGLGKIAKGEGVLGLTRALLYAGASNIIVSLWKVSDASTARLMELFYTNLMRTNDLSVSLQKAKLQLLEEMPASQFRPSVYYWSPFILIGY